MKSGSRLERVLESGQFAVTGELGPPKGADAGVITKKMALLRGNVDAVNVTDNQTAIVRMSSIASARILVENGIEPVMQMVCRDRNRIAMQSDIFGAHALGIRNILCLTGDHQKFGNHPEAKNVFDMDSIGLIHMVRRMRDENKALCGDELEGEVKMFIGAAENPFGGPLEFRAARLGKKVRAGVDFFQTQCIYDMKIFESWMAEVRRRELHGQCYILAGVTPLKSVGMAKYMKSRVAGITIPDELIDRLAKAPKEHQKQEGLDICVEQIKHLRNIEGVAGVHIMAIEWESAVKEIVEKAGLLPRPEVK
ncbi:MAG: methylenetetrahydrofolate reductase [bacterium]